jgi:hypothetical protein
MLATLSVGVELCCGDLTKGGVLRTFLRLEDCVDKWIAT